MISFKKFIAEVARSPERAARLVAWMSQRPKYKAPDLVRIGSRPDKHDTDQIKPLIQRKRDTGDLYYNIDHPSVTSRVEHIPFHKIYTFQDSVSSGVVADKLLKGPRAHADDHDLKHYADDEYNPELIHHKDEKGNDAYFLHAGNHRAAVEKLNGSKSLKARVYYGATDHEALKDDPFYQDHLKRQKQGE